MRAGRNLCRDVRYFRNQREAALRAVAVGEAQVLEAADLAARHLGAVHQDDERGRSLHAARIQTRIDAVAFEEIEVVLAVDREHMGKRHATRVPSGNPSRCVFWPTPGPA